MVLTDTREGRLPEGSGEVPPCQPRQEAIRDPAPQPRPVLEMPV
jgi:hypothetical protein